jgi:hypothetical protein
MNHFQNVNPERAFFRGSSTKSVSAFFWHTRPPRRLCCYWQVSFFNDLLRVGTKSHTYRWPRLVPLNKNVDRLLNGLDIERGVLQQDTSGMRDSRRLDDVTTVDSRSVQFLLVRRIQE